MSERSLFKAVIIGSTGAIGSELVLELLTSAKWSKITTVGRRKFDGGDKNHSLVEENEKSGRLVQLISTVDEIDCHSDYFKDHDYFFSCFGTTRSDAGGGSQFHKIEYGFITTCAKFAKENGVNHASLISSMGANPNSWLQYMQTKGMIEENLKTLNFDCLEIYRPGLLGRGDRARGNEKLGAWFQTPIPVTTIAKAMRINAGIYIINVLLLENILEKKSEYEKVLMYDNSKIYKSAE